MNTGNTNSEARLGLGLGWASPIGSDTLFRSDNAFILEYDSSIGIPFDRNIFWNNKIILLEYTDTGLYTRAVLQLLCTFDQPIVRLLYASMIAARS